MHALAATLHTSVAALEAGLSAREFAHWQTWMDREQVGPAWDRLRHAELLAAVHNGAAQRRGGGVFSAADFMPPDPWAQAPQVTPAGQAGGRVDRDALRGELLRMWTGASVH